MPGWWALGLPLPISVQYLERGESLLEMENQPFHPDGMGLGTKSGHAGPGGGHLWQQVWKQLQGYGRGLPLRHAAVVTGTERASHAA